MEIIDKANKLRNYIQVGSGYIEWKKKDFDIPTDYRAFINDKEYLFLDKNDKVIKKGDWVLITWGWKTNHRYGQSYRTVSLLDGELCVHDNYKLLDLDEAAQSVEVAGNM